jgi:hypothetical protein
MPNKKTADESTLEQCLRDFESQALNYAFRFVSDAKVRSEYIAQAKALSRTTRQAYDMGEITAVQAQGVANAMRNQVMELARAKTSPMGQTVAIILKEKGIPLDDLIGKYAKQKFGKAPTELSAVERDAVALEVVAASGRTSPGVNRVMARVGKVGRTFWVLTALIAAYNIGAAENKAVAAGREAANIGGGFAGGAGGGALVGAMMTGPAAPIGAAIGAVIGGILGAAIADEAYVEAAVPLSETVARLLPRYTFLFYRDEEGLANALYEECGINIDEVCEVVQHLSEYYNTDVDDVVVAYVELVRKFNGIVQEALKLHPTAKTLLIDTLESGWTDSGERSAIEFLTRL